MRRYEPFLYSQDEKAQAQLLRDTAQALVNGAAEADGVYGLSFELSEAEQAANTCQCRQVEVAHAAICDLMQRDDIHLEISRSSFALSHVQALTEAEVLGKSSPLLSRERMLNAQPHEVAGALIDLVLDLGQWPGLYESCQILGWAN